MTTAGERRFADVAMAIVCFAPPLMLAVVGIMGLVLMWKVF